MNGRKHTKLEGGEMIRKERSEWEEIQEIYNLLENTINMNVYKNKEYLFKNNIILNP